MQIPILNGIYADVSADFRTKYPTNFVPVPKSSGVSEGYLKLAKGIDQFASVGPDPEGTDRGGINWNGACYRVVGKYFLKVNNDQNPPSVPLGTCTVLGSLSAGKQASFDYSFDRLGIAANGNLYYWDGTTFSQVTDPDLGKVVDVIWIDGYWMTTDGENLVVTDLNDPFSVNPLKYGSSEIDPDPILALQKLRNEVYALNRYTIEVFQNVGGTNFPFERIEGAMIPKGAIGTHACCEYRQSIAFLGSARNEEPSLYIASQGAARKIATRELEQMLQRYTEEQLADVILETRAHEMHEHLYIHLPDVTIVYDEAASEIAQQPVFFNLVSGTDGSKPYRARNFVWCYDKWICGDVLEPNRIGKLTDEFATVYGEGQFGEFGTMAAYNEGRGAILSSLELVRVPGYSPTYPMTDPRSISHSYSYDGLTYSQAKFVQFKDPETRLQWRRCGRLKSWRTERFQGVFYEPVSFARLEAIAEPLNV